MKHIHTFESFVNENLNQVFEGAMSDIDVLAQESKNEAEFIKKFMAEYGDKVKDNIETKKWLGELFADAKTRK